jgi:hypothetical protein
MKCQISGVRKMKHLSGLSLLDVSWSAILGWLVIALALDVLIVDVEGFRDLVAEGRLVVDAMSVLESQQLITTA